MSILDILQGKLGVMYERSVTMPSARAYALPNGGTTTSREEAREQWFYHNLMKNVVKCHVSGKNKYCAGRL